MKRVHKNGIKVKEHTTAMKALKRGLLTTAAFILTVGLLLAGPQTAWAKKKGHSSANAVDPTSITSCGTLNANNTIYVLVNPIVTTGTGNCLILGGSNQTLDLNDNDITFTGTPGTSAGAGVMITSAASEDVVEGDNSTITGFQQGVLDQGLDTAGDDINLIGNGVGMELNGGGFFGGTEIWTNFAANNNTAQGVFLNACGDECTISDFFAGSNGADGVLITGSAGARVSVFSSIGNVGAGVHVGCPGVCGTNSVIKIGDAPNGGGGSPAIAANGGDGVFLDASESANADQVYLDKVSGNGGIDMHDATTNCGNNHWVHNQFGTSQAGAVLSPACIPNGTIP